MLRTPRRTAAVWTVALLFAAGCASSAGSPPGAAPKLAEPALPAAIADPPDGSAPALPMDAYGISAAESALIHRADEELIRRCMQDKGFGYTLTELAAPPGPAAIEPDHLGLVSAKAAAVTGYRRPPQATGQTSTQQDPQPPAYNLALRGWDRAPAQGVPVTGGCIADVQKQLGRSGRPASGPPAQELISTIKLQALAATAADSRVKAALAGWSACMKGHGYDYADPVAPLAAAWPDPVGGQELRTAADDVGCKGQVTLLGTWYAVQAGYQQELIRGHENELAGIKEQSSARVAAAKQLLGAG